MSADISQNQAAPGHYLENAFKQRLKSSLLAHEYDTWFGPTKLTETDGRAVLLVPNHFYAEWIKDRYLGHAQEALDRAAGKSMDLYFDLDPALAKPEPRPGAAPPVVSDPPQAVLNRRYNFANFVVGPCNELAHAACRAVAEQPGRQYNPLFIFGGAGLGKTHLLVAAGNFIQEHFPEMTVHYSTSEDFTNELIRAVRFDGIHTFKAKFRKLDCLLLDDIQFLAGRERTQEELFHTFNNIFEAGKQIIVTSDKMPREIPALEKRLRTRFEWGLLADLQPPDEETKVAIIQKKAAEKGLTIAKGVAFFMASQPDTNVRVLEGYLNRLVAVSRLKSQEITKDLVKKVLGPMVGRRRVELDQVIRAVAGEFGVKVGDIKGSRRTREISLPRQVAMYLSRKLTSASYPEIGRGLGGKDHSTVVKGFKKVKKQIKTDALLAQRIKSVERTLLEDDFSGDQDGAGD